MGCFARTLLNSCVLLVLAAGIAPTAAAQMRRVVHFDSKDAVSIEPAGSEVVTLLNDSGTAFAIKVTGSLDPASDSATGEATPLGLRVDTGAGFEVPGPKTELPAAGRMLIRVRAPGAASAGQSGLVTVVASAGSETVVARRQVEVATPEPTVDAWTTTSRQAVPTKETGGDLDASVPLSSESGCESLGDPGTVLVSEDRTVAITSSCVDDGLRLTAADFGPGTYKGKLKVGAASVDLEVRRTLSIFWPIAFILLGILAAVWVRGRTDHGWLMQERRWLKKLPKDAAKADATYSAATTEAPWEPYEVTEPVKEEAAALGKRLDQVVDARTWWLRWLPWPEGFMASEREAIRKRTVELNELVATWASMPGVFAAARARVEAQPYYVTRAPRLVERALRVLGAEGLPVDARELAARCAEMAALPDAFDVVDDLERLDAYLTALERDSEPRPPEDDSLLVRARQYERQAGSTLAELRDATKVPDEAGRVVERAAKLASRLREPSSRREGMRTQTVDTAADLVTLPLGLFRRATSLFGDSGPLPLGHSAVFLVTLVVGVLSGLGLLYFGKAWGGSWTDFAAAFVWGYAASTVIDPIVSAVKQIGARPGDAPEPKPAG
jgi:hypothetical protein